MSPAISMTTTEALKWALQRISTSLDEGEYFARAKEALDNAERLEYDRAHCPHLVLPLTIIRDDRMGYFYAFVENMPTMAVGTEEMLDVLSAAGREINDILSAELRPYTEWAGAIVTLVQDGDGVSVTSVENHGLTAGTHRLYANINDTKGPPFIPAGWRLPSGALVTDIDPPLGEYDEHLRPLCRQLFTLRADPTRADIEAAHATRKIKGARA